MEGRRKVQSWFVRAGGIVLVAVGLVAPLLSASPAAAVSAPTCSYSGSTVTVDATGADNYALYVWRSSGQIRVAHDVDYNDYVGASATDISCTGGGINNSATTLTINTSTLQWTDVMIQAPMSSWSGTTINIVDSDSADDGDYVIMAGTPGNDVMSFASPGFTLNLTDVSCQYLYGFEGNDTLTLGTSSSCRYAFGGSGDDTLIPTAGLDRLFGDLGVDTVDYTSATSAVFINLARQITGGGADGDRLNSIENLTGSAFADELFGDALANIFLGGEGDDYLRGGNGDDTLTGNGGTDLALGQGGSDTCSAETAHAC